MDGTGSNGPGWRRAWATCAIAVALGDPRPALAQIVNVQQLAGKPTHPGLSGHVALAGDLVTGNTQIATASGSATLYYRHAPWLALATVSGAYGVKGNAGVWAADPFQEKIFEHARLRRHLDGALAVEAFAQHEFDRWRRLQKRIVTGGGLRADVDAVAGLHVAFGLAWMAQWEQLLKPGPGDAAGLVLEHRLSTYAVGAVELSDHAALTATAYVQPLVTDWADLRGLGDLAVTVSASKATALRAGWLVGYDTRPPANVRGLDSTVKLSFIAAF